MSNGMFGIMEEIVVFLTLFLSGVITIFFLLVALIAVFYGIYVFVKFFVKSAINLRKPF